MVPSIEEGHHLMADSDPSLEVHNMDLAGINLGLDMMDSSPEEENLRHNMINRKPKQRTYLISHVALDVGVGNVIRQRGHVKKLRR